MKLSIKKREKISEQILAFLYSTNPKPVFTSEIAEEIARDDTFVKKILQDLKKKKLIIEINKNPKGKGYLRRARWLLSPEVYERYKTAQPN